MVEDGVITNPARHQQRISDMCSTFRTRRTAMVFLVVMVLFCSADFVSACPTCKNSVAGQEHLIRGYFWSIVFMMSMPFILLTSFSAYFYYLVRKARVAETTDAFMTYPALSTGSLFRG